MIGSRDKDSVSHGTDKKRLKPDGVLNFLPRAIAHFCRQSLASQWFVGGLVALMVTAIVLSLGRNLALLELSENCLAVDVTIRKSWPKVELDRGVQPGFAVTSVQMSGDGDPGATEAFAEIAAAYPDGTLIRPHHRRSREYEFDATLVIRRK